MPRRMRGIGEMGSTVAEMGAPPRPISLRVMPSLQTPAPQAESPSTVFQFRSDNQLESLPGLRSAERRRDGRLRPVRRPSAFG